MNFQPILRFAVMSDLHYDKEYPFVRERFQKSMETIYRVCAQSDYSKLDALYINGDFTNRGKREEMEMLAADCERYIRPETKLVMTLANHELHYVADYRAAMADFTDVFGMAFDRHEIIGGYHFISLSGTIDKGPWHDSYDAPKREFLKRELEIARREGGNRPIFVFQHVGMTGTVRGGVYGNAELYEILSDYPQVIDFSGHSHFPCNHPAEIHQGSFVSVSSGGLYNIVEQAAFLNPEVGCDTCTDEHCAHMLLVEVDESACVRIRRLDVTAGDFFENDSYIAWSERENGLCIDNGAGCGTVPYFAQNAAVKAAREDDGLRLSFPRAHCDDARVAAYRICMQNSGGDVIRQKYIVSDYRYLKQKETVCTTLECPSDTVDVSVYACGFHDEHSEPLRMVIE